MKVSELIAELNKFPNNMEVIISDGLDYVFYNTNDLEIREFEGMIDIGIGGCRETEKED
jgi:hypothetical protein